MATINSSDLTTRETDGTGVFDELMETIEVRLQREFTSGRITGPEYSKVYLGSMQFSLSLSLV